MPEGKLTDLQDVEEIRQLIAERGVSATGLTSVFLFKGPPGSRSSAPLSKASTFFAGVPAAEVRETVVSWDAQLTLVAPASLSRPFLPSKQPWLAIEEHSLLPSNPSQRPQCRRDLPSSRRYQSIRAPVGTSCRAFGRKATSRRMGARRLWQACKSRGEPWADVEPHPVGLQIRLGIAANMCLDWLSKPWTLTSSLCAGEFFQTSTWIVSRPQSVSCWVRGLSAATLREP